MTARHYLLLSKACVGAAAVVFAFDVLDSVYLAIAGSRSWDPADGRTASLNFLKGFTLYVTPGADGGCVVARFCAGLLFLLGAFCYARLRRAASDVVEQRGGPD